MPAAHYDRLSATDLVFLELEDGAVTMHIGAVCVFAGEALLGRRGAFDMRRMRAFVAASLAGNPRFRQRLAWVPLLDHPVWVDDPDFDLARHVRHARLPKPGGARALKRFAGTLMSEPLPRDRPLWEMWFVDGLAGDHVGMIIKTHHALGDGIANVDLALALVDLEPDPPPDAPVPDWTPRPAPSPNDLLTDAVREQLARPGQMARAMLDAVRDPRPTIDAVTNVGRTVANFLAKPPPAPWNVPVSPHRRWVTASVTLSGVRTVRKRHGVSINDVVLAACSGALRTFLLEHGDDDIEHRVIKAMVPVSLRGQEQHGDTLGNLVSLIIVDLPVDEADPVERLRRIHAMTSELKGSGLVDGAHRILDIADVITPLAGPITRYVSRTIPMNLVITNIPGPPVPLYLRGARFLRVFPYVEVIDNEGLTIAVVSYDDQLHFGITSDRDVLPDLGDVAASIEHEFAVLAKRR